MLGFNFIWLFLPCKIWFEYEYDWSSRIQPRKVEVYCYCCSVVLKTMAFRAFRDFSNFCLDPRSRLWRSFVSSLDRRTHTFSAWFSWDHCLDRLCSPQHHHRRMKSSCCCRDVSRWPLNASTFVLLKFQKNCVINICRFQPSRWLQLSTNYLLSVDFFA